MRGEGDTKIEVNRLVYMGWTGLMISFHGSMRCLVGVVFYLSEDIIFR